MELNKISFGFSKITKKTNIVSNSLKQEEKKVELVECLEGQNIKVKDAVEEVKEPLIIPLKDNEKNLLDRIRASKNKSKKDAAKQEESEDSRPDSELTPDELAARQLIRDAKQRLANGNTISNSKVDILPASTDPPDLEGEKEPTLEDYESVPINDFGIALLRGMGWKEGMPIGKNVSKAAPLSVPELRPKGLGLGASKVVLDEMPNKKAKDIDGKELILVKNAFAKIIAGPHKGCYCQVQGFDEDAGRVIIKVYPRGDIVNINELMLIPVTKDEFSKGSKFINNAKYEEYKQLSDKKLDTFKVKQERTDYNSEKDYKEEKSKKADRNVKKELADSDSDNATRRRANRSSQKYNDSSPERRKSSKSNRRSRSKSKDKSSSRKHRSPSKSSDKEYYKKKKSHKHTKSKNRNRSKSRSKSRDKDRGSKNRRNRVDSSDSDHKYEKSKSKKSGSKRRSRSRGEERHSRR